MLRRGLGWSAIAVGAFMGLGILLNLGSGFSVVPFVLAFAFCTVLPVAVGVALVRGGSERRLAGEAEPGWEAELLRLAERRGGCLTVAEVVAHADLAPEAAESHLERLCARGLAEHRVAESGVIVYRIAGLLGDGEKQRAVGVLDD